MIIILSDTGVASCEIQQYLEESFNQIKGMKKILSIGARAFTHKRSGGNPVTVFFLPTSNQNPAEDVRSSLAQRCDWESVMVHFLSDKDDSESAINFDALKGGTTSKFTMSVTPSLYFYMPSGEEVSYCAHAAMGASYALTYCMRQQNMELDYHEKEVKFVTAQGISNTAIIRGKDVELGMTNDLQEEVIDMDTNNSDVIPLLLDQIGLSMDDIVGSDDLETGSALPILNASVARHKTMVPVKSLTRLNNAQNPKEAEEFRRLCDSITSTGLYLYTCVPKIEIGSQNTYSVQYECRQFPRASGYPEDPATGIAAAALSSSLHRHNVNQGVSNFEIYQGTAMGKRSNLNIRLDNEKVYCSGAVEIDSEEYITLNSL